MNSKKNLLAATVAFFMGAGAQVGVAQDGEVATQQNQIDEIIVTATKRGDGTSLQDTAMAISVLSSDTIEKRGLVEMKDYLATLPGVSYIEFAPGENRIVIRGLSLGPSDSQNTAGAYLGEMPMSSASRSAFDIKLVDIERVEVLRGPQGTLYGSSSTGGTVRSIPAAPNLEALEGSIKGNFYTQSESDDMSQSFEGVINIPLVDDQLALRVAAYHHDNAGYVDSISTLRQKRYLLLLVLLFLCKMTSVAAPIRAVVPVYCGSQRINCRLM